MDLVRLGIATLTDAEIPKDVDWKEIHFLAEEHGITGLVLDGLNRISMNQRPGKIALMQLIGSVLRGEERFAIQWRSACEMALLFDNNAIRTYVLKGFVISECYPNPKHRYSADLDCFLLSSRGDSDVWELGNQLIEHAGFEVSRGFYKNSSFHLPGLMVENHRFMVPFRGNTTLKEFEKLLESYLRVDKGENKIEGTGLYRPPVMMSALFIIEHAYSHFLHEGLTWRHVLDWAMFSRRHQPEIDWVSFDVSIDAFGFRKFYESYVKMGRFLLGELSEDELNAKDKMMLADVWAPLDLHETRHGVKGKLALAGNTWRARWKYRHFAEISMPHALWIQVKGFLFMKNPTLE